MKKSLLLISLMLCLVMTACSSNTTNGSNVGKSRVEFPKKPELKPQGGQEAWNLSEDQPGGQELPRVTWGTAETLRESQAGPATRQGAENFALGVVSYAAADLPREEALATLEAVSSIPAIRSDSGLNQSQGLVIGKFKKTPMEIWLRSGRASGDNAWDVRILLQRAIDGANFDGSTGTAWMWGKRSLRVAYISNAWWVLSARTGSSADGKEPRNDPYYYQRDFDQGKGWRKTVLTP